MKQEKAEWVVGLDEDHFNCDDTYPSKEEAIKAGREELMNAEPYNPESYTSYSEVFHDDVDNDVICFFVGRIASPCPKVYAEGFLEGVDNDEKEKLECAVNNVIQGWIDKHGLNINAFLVEDVEQVKI